MPKKSLVSIVGPTIQQNHLKIIMGQIKPMQAIFTKIKIFIVFMTNGLKKLALFHKKYFYLMLQ